MNGLFIAEPFNGLERAMAMFQTHPPLEARLRNLLVAQRGKARPRPNSFSHRVHAARSKRNAAEAPRGRGG
jgi:hypothetical protein